MAYQPELEKLERRYQEDPGRNFAQLAESYRKLGRLDDALDVLRAHLTDRPNYVSGLVVLGRCLLDQQSDAEARETFERVLAVDAEHIIALKALGEIAERAQQIGAARGWYQRLLDIDPMNEDAAAALSRLPAGGEAPSPVEAPQMPAAAEEVPAAPDEAAPAETAPEPWVPPVAEAAAEPAPFFLAGTREPPQLEPLPPAAGSPELAAAAPSPWTEAPAEPEVVPASWAEPIEPPAAFEPPEPGAPDVTPEAAGATPAPGAEILHEEPAPVAELEVRTDEFSDDVTIERASSEYVADVDAVELEPVAIERTGEVDMPLEPPVELPATEQPQPDLGGEEAEAPAEAVATGPAAETPDESPWFAAVDEAEAIALEPAAGGSDADELVIEPFDESLGWDAVDRLSRQISSDDLAEAEQLHEDSLEVPVQEILEPTEAVLPDEAEIEALKTAHVNGLETVPSSPPDVPPLEGLRTTELEAMPPVEEPEATEPDLVAEAPLMVDAAEGEAQEAARQEADRRASLAGLPVFMPDDAEEAAEPLVVDAEPEPVVTETMAELYARQGLVAEARDVYRQLLQARPDDARLGARLAELEAPARPLAQPTIRYLAAESGGQRVRDFLADVLAARASVATEQGPGGGPDGREQVEAQAAGPEPMETAFGEEGGEIRGAPTQPAADEVSLAAIFGETAPAPPPAAGPAGGGRGEPEHAPGGFSFDEFFAKGSQGDAAERGRAPRDTLADDEGDDAFRDWLKSLKS
jgi:tetratricopeptide (TPR) repeat protein